MKKFKVKFSDGYSIEVSDCEGKSYKEIYDAAKEHYKSFKDSNPTITPKSNLLPQVTKIRNAINKKTGEVIDEELLDYEIRKIEIDMAADLTHENWKKKYHPTALKTIVSDYQKLINEIKVAKDEKYVAKVAELEEKLAKIAEIFGVSEEEPAADVEDSCAKDSDDLAYRCARLRRILAHYDGIGYDNLSPREQIDYDRTQEELDKLEAVAHSMKRNYATRDMGVKAPTDSYSLNPEPYFSVDDIDNANEWLDDPKRKEFALDILENEYPAVRKNMENDIDNAVELTDKFTKDQLREFMRIYESIANVYAKAKMEAEYKTLSDLYTKLYYNALHLGRLGKTVTGSLSVEPRRGRR